MRSLDPPRRNGVGLLSVQAKDSPPRRGGFDRSLVEDGVGLLFFAIILPATNYPSVQFLAAIIGKNITTHYPAGVKYE